MTETQFYKEFNSLEYLIKRAKNILIIAHSMPDADTLGSTLALSEFIKINYKKNIQLTCFNQMPDYLNSILGKIDFFHPDNLDLKSFDLVIGCDSVQRGMDKIIKKISKKALTIAIDHHPDINLKTDLEIIDANFSSVCEILYNFFKFTRGEINRKIATYLLTGIVGDTGAFQHSNTSSKVLSASSELVNLGAPLSKIINLSFSNKKFDTLKLWGKAIERTRFFSKSGLAVTAITQEDMDNQGKTIESASDIANILTTIPGIKVALIISQIKPNQIKGSLRTEEKHNINVSEIAKTLGGGGHTLASGFEINGKIILNKSGNWMVI